MQSRSAALVSSAVATEVAVVSAVTISSAVVGFRTNESAQVKVIYADNKKFRKAITTAPVTTTSATDFTGSIPLVGLSANQMYWYRVVVDEVEQDPGFVQKFQTFPNSGNCKLAVFADVANNLSRNAPNYQQGKEDGALFALQIGDFDHRNPTTLAESRTMHRELRDPATAQGDDFARHILSKMGIAHVWDDHDYCGNDTDRTCASRSTAWEAFGEYWPSYPRPNAANGIWHKFTCGDAEIFMLDTRSQRDPDTDPDDANKSMLDGANIAPDDQKSWLKNGLKDSTATWKIVVSTVTSNNDARPNNIDHWKTSFSTEATEMASWITSQSIENVVMISADLHTGGGIDDGANSCWGIPEMTVAHTNLPGGNANNLGTWSEGITPSPSGQSGYSMITITPSSLLLEAKGSDGSLRHSYSLTP
jgi:alkaline phosphatase D